MGSIIWKWGELTNDGVRICPDCHDVSPEDEMHICTTEDDMAKGGAPSKQREKELKDIQDSLDIESKLWAENGIDPAGIQVHAFLLDTKVQALLDAIIDMDIISEDDLNFYFKKRLLKELQEHREQLVPAVQEARRKALSPTPAERMKLLKPDGEPFH